MRLNDVSGTTIGHCARTMAIALLLCAAAAFAREPDNVPPPAADRVHLAIRTDESAGTGTEDDPFDAGTAAKFDALMAKFWETHGAKWVNGEYQHGKPLAIHLGRGVFETAALSAHGSNPSAPFATQHWLAKGWSLRGAGMHETEVRNVNPRTGGVWMFNSSGGSWGGPESGEVTIADLTLNPRKSAHQDSNTYRVTITSADGKTSTIEKPAHGWEVGTRIEVNGENYNGPVGSWDGGGWKVISAVTADTFSWNSKNTLTGAVTVKRVGEWNGTRINGASSRAERVRVIDGGANSIAETWPLWVSGDNCVIESCVVERCSGIMSAIASMPGANRTIRNCVVDGAGCDAVLGISAVEQVENCTVRNASIGIYADTFASSAGIAVRNNTVENVGVGGIVIRPHDHSQKFVVTGNRVRGGPAQVGIWIDPLSNHWTENEWRSAAGEKIWIDEVLVADNDVGDKRIEMSQTRGVTIRNNVTGSGAFHRMPEPQAVSGNRTAGGDVPDGLADRP